ncbi:hypothetical protein TNCV_3868611 [Trichonephila clavipes]|nr:hypothetical protein TNCV_3868611 [Trichonephila clavipes]
MFGDDLSVQAAKITKVKSTYIRNGRATSPFGRLVEGKERWEASDYPQSVLPLHWGGAEPKSFCHLYGAQSYG